MTVEVLVATMHQAKGDYSLLDRMNIQSDVVVCNQCDRNEIEEFKYKSYLVKWYSFAERGVGLNRNNALMRSKAEILIIADDDMVFRDGYRELVENWMKVENKADILLFHLEKDGKPINPTKRIKRIRQHNFGRYGAARMVLRGDTVRLFGISFNIMFGGGCPYSCGEDSLFLSDCIKKGLRLVAVPDTIACLCEIRESTWFRGYTDKYFFDRGIVYYLINKKLAVFYSLYHCYRKRKRYSQYGWFKAWKQMCNGINSVKR